MILEHLGIDQGRFSVLWVSAAEATRFVQAITAFDSHIYNLGPLGGKENLDMKVLAYKLRAAKMALEGRMFRMAFAKQAKQMKEDNTYGKFPSKEKLLETFIKEMALYETLVYLKEKDRPASELARLLTISEEQVTSNIEMLRKRNLWGGDKRTLDGETKKLSG